MFCYILSVFCSRDLQPGLYSFIWSENTSTICFQSTLFFPLTEQAAKQQSVRFQKQIFNRECLAVHHQSPAACENCLHYLSSFCWIYLLHSKSPYPPVYDKSQWSQNILRIGGGPVPNHVVPLLIGNVDTTSLKD